MENEIPFIHNLEDYENYKKLRPTKIYQRRKVRFICHSCQKESIKGFRSLTPDFLCIHCQARQGTLNARDKFKETCIKKYGVDNPGKAKSVIEKHKQTCLEKYGVSSYNKTEEFKERYKNTCLNKYGVTNTTNVPEIREKIKQTNLEKYGNEYAIASVTVKEKIKNTNLEKYGYTSSFKNLDVQNRFKENCIEKYGVDNPIKLPEIKEKIKQTNLEKYGYENPMSSDEIKEKVFNTKFKRYGNPYYTGINTGTIFSKFEKSVLNFIKENFSSLIIEENNRTILKGKEIDLYFPEIQKGIEINGDYWHCNPLIYESTYINRKGKTAEEIWKHDNEKYKLAKEQKIELLIIWEYDWMHNKNSVQEYIKTFLNI